MKKMQKKLITTVLIIIFLSSSIGILFGCTKKNKYLETEYFRYQVYTRYDEERVSIEGLTEKGRQQKNIVIPEEIDGKRVTIYQGHDEAPNVKKIIVSYNIFTINSWGLSDGTLFIYGYPAGLKVLYVNCQYKKATSMEPHFLIASAALESFQKNIPNPIMYIPLQTYNTCLIMKPHRTKACFLLMI